MGSDPSLHILDTPGVMQPSLASYEAALRLGLTGKGFRHPWVHAMAAWLLFGGGALGTETPRGPPHPAAFKDSMVGEAELVRYLIGRLAIRKSGMRRKESSSSIVRTVRQDPVQTILLHKWR